MSKTSIILIIVIIILSISINASATVPVSTAFQGFAEEPFFIFVHYEDASAIGHTMASIEQNMRALEYAFSRLKIEEKLDFAFPGLIIVARKQYRVENRFETIPTTLSFTNSAMLISNNPDSIEFEPVELGPSYVIETTTGLLNYSDLIAMMLRLSDLGEHTPVVTISNEDELALGKRKPDFNRFMDIKVEHNIHNFSGGLSVLPIWDSQVLHFSLIDQKGSTIAQLQPMDLYIGRLSWPPVERAEHQGRFLAYSSPEKAIVYDIINEKYHTLNLDLVFNDPHTKEIFDGMGGVQRVEFAMHANENRIFVFPLGQMLSLNAIYSLNLDTSEWVREFEGSSLYEQVWTNRNEGVWLDLLPATTDQSIRNADVIINKWEEGQPFPVVSLKPAPVVRPPAADVKPAHPDFEEQPEAADTDSKQTNETTNYSQALWLLLPVITVAAIIVLKRKHRQV